MKTSHGVEWSYSGYMLVEWVANEHKELGIQPLKSICRALI